MLVGVAAEPVVPPPLIDTPGVPVEEKKPVGKVSVIKPPAVSAPPAVVLKANVASTCALPATRSPDKTLNVTDVTAPPITPDPTAADAVGSALVFTVTSPPTLATPMVRPVSVTVTAALAASALPDVVMTMEVAPVACGIRVALAVESVAVSVGDVAKNPDG